jgi:hypothetical protein
MSDDGRGREVTIPAVLINKADGLKLEEFYRQNKDNEAILKNVVLEIDFEMEHPNNTVKYDIYFSSENEDVYTLLKELHYYQRKLENFVNLTVHYVTYQNPNYGSNVYEGFKNCYGRGKYCSNPGKFGTNDGRDIVRENLNQKCIYNYAYKVKNNKDLYWNYMDEFYQQCLNITEPKLDAECSAIVQKKVGLPNADINKCVGDSWISDPNIIDLENKPNYALNFLLEEDNQSRRVYSISFLPAITINGRNFFGTWSGENVFEAICAGFKKKPEVCYTEGAFRKDGLGFFSIFFIVILIIAVNVIIFYFCKNYIKSKIIERIESTDINHKINTVVTSYLALRDNK